MQGQTRIEVPRQRRKSTEVNPCRAVFGAGPMGTTCSACDAMMRWNPTGAHVYRRCRPRRNTRGHATHHSPRWRSCAKYKVTP